MGTGETERVGKIVLMGDEQMELARIRQQSSNVGTSENTIINPEPKISGQAEIKVINTFARL